MIRRIKKIKGVGRFLDVGHIDLARLTLIYGPNCYGKSTLADIFRSMMNKNPEILLNRESIVRNGNPINQEICFGFKDNTVVSEQTISCLGQNWNTGSFNCKIEVFDSRFIEDNVFTGLKISRANKQNLTNLLMGDISVEIGKKIESLKNVEIREKANNIGHIEESIKKILSSQNLELSLENFISIKKPSDIKKIKSKVEILQNNLKKYKKSILDKNKISEINELVVINLENPAILIKSIENNLKSNFENISNDAYKRMREHIDKNFNVHDGKEEEWIKVGLKYYLKQNQDSSKLNCPFCGQTLEKVFDLIDTYKSFFSDEYNKFCKNIEGILDNNLEELKDFYENIKSIENSVNKNLVICRQWQDYFPDEEQNYIIQIESLTSKLIKLNSNFINLVLEFLEHIVGIISEKKNKPFVPIKKFPNIENLSLNYKELNTILEQYNSSINLFNKGIKNFKEKSQSDKLIDEVQNLEDDIERLNIKIKRYELSEEIDNLEKLKEEKNNIEEEIKRLQKKLERENEDFIKKYFQDISDIFNRLGSGDFQIEPSFTRRGNQPVYEPIIKFADNEISYARLPYIFSDADRRSLAFSIFLSKLMKKSESELMNTIVFLDDPVTSFDENRISQSFIEIKKIANCCHQLIVAAHYSKFLLDIYDRLKSSQNIDLKFLEIKRKAFGSILSLVNDPKTRLDPHSQEIEKVEKFIEGDSSVSGSDVRRSLRPILQKELEWRFRPALKGEAVVGLGNITNKLKEKNVISEEISKKIYDFNEVLRDDHHNTDLDIDEDTRNLSIGIIKFIFEDLNPIVNP